MSIFTDALGHLWSQYKQWIYENEYPASKRNFVDFMDWCEKGKLND